MRTNFTCLRRPFSGIIQMNSRSPDVEQSRGDRPAFRVVVLTTQAVADEEEAVTLMDKWLLA
jgi:hypothetical protein